MRYGVMGGTFDPPHLGHTIPVAEAATQYELDVVLFLPAFIPPHKSSDHLTSAYHRMALLAIALENYPRFVISLSELLRGKVSYTIDTVRKLKRSLKRDDRLFFILGSDSFLELTTWHEYRRLIKTTEMIIINRGHRKEELNSYLKQLQKDVRLNLEGNINFASSSFLPISSTQIRRLLEQGKSVSKFVTPGVEAYIRKHSLYQRR